ncbi:TPA: ead/Ea22-like family protein [Klebsiella variicola subsp. variicola]
MTDITELAQRMKAAAEKASNGDWVKESGDGWDATCSNDDQANSGFIIAHFVGPDSEANREFVQLANPANVLALVEALEKAQQRIAELESRTVKLPKPHAHLIWIQAGHAPDDYWDDVAVSHSEKDRCCDGSERYPVYARWEIEEMLAAAGIKVEAE